MIYGMDEHEELSLVESRKLNLKKVALVGAIILAIIVFLFISIAFKSDAKNEVASLENDNIIKNEEIFNEIEIDTTIPSSPEEQENNYASMVIKEPVQVETVEFSIPMHNFEAIQARYIPQYNENAHSIIKDLYYSDEKQVYLTFDDGPTKTITPKILDILKEENVKATFFVLGYRIELSPELLKREYDEGHYIANHGYSHEYSRIYESKDTVFQEYINCENSIRTALGIPEYNTYLFRFPGGSTGGKYSAVKNEARQWLNENGIAFTNWNCLTGDAENKKTKEACINELMRTIGNQKSLIVLMHDASDKTQTVEALPEIIHYFKNEGYAFKTFEDIFN